ncbi:endolytic transglycosylase MltG [[Clostridium] polysaccharolyticum]|nr:endolytic transglycosylase MltG [[Clostridium] polysaccharolyticum]
MKHVKQKLKWFVTGAVVCIGILSCKSVTVNAAAAEYGLLVGNSSGHYTYYDLNGGKTTQRIEKSSGKVMVPVKKVSSYMSVLSYEYNWEQNKAAIKNKKNGKKIVLTKNSQYAYMYASKNAKVKKVKLSAKSYISSGSGALMADVKVFRYVFPKAAGYSFISTGDSEGKKKISQAYYNSPNLKSIIVYNPYKAVTSLPKADTVSFKSANELSSIVRLTIPEGYSLAQIADLTVKKGVCQSTKAFIKAANAVMPSSYWFLKDVKKTSARCFYLEGYLYPSTYEFYRNTAPEDVLAKILKNTGNQLTKAQEARAKELGYTLDQVLAIASIIEKEVSISTEQANVSSVLHNRLSSSEKLQCDATINYVEHYIKPYITGNKDRYNVYYNTYKCKALPSGPICNPGKKAIQAALYPNNTNYLFFCSSKKGKYYYSETYKEHQAIWEEIKNGLK